MTDLHVLVVGALLAVIVPAAALAIYLGVQAKLAADAPWYARATVYVGRCLYAFGLAAAVLLASLGVLSAVGRVVIAVSGR